MEHNISNYVRNQFSKPDTELCFYVGYKQNFSQDKIEKQSYGVECRENCSNLRFLSKTSP